MSWFGEYASFTGGSELGKVMLWKGLELVAEEATVFVVWGSRVCKWVEGRKSCAIQALSPYHKVRSLQPTCSSLLLGDMCWWSC